MEIPIISPGQDLAWSPTSSVIQRFLSPSRARTDFGFQGKNGFWLAVEGVGEVIRDKEEFARHWNPDIEKWFEEGVDTEGLVMLKIGAKRGHYWDGRDEVEIKF
jgi:general stress protein 26